MLADKLLSAAHQPGGSPHDTDREVRLDPLRAPSRPIFRPIFRPTCGPTCGPSSRSKPCPVFRPICRPISHEVRHLELLKKRFGEVALQHCEVMLRDVGESRRITTGIHKHFGDTDIQVPSPHPHPDPNPNLNPNPNPNPNPDPDSNPNMDIQVVDVTVVSRTCWPSLPAEVFQLPTKVQQQLDRYEKQFLHAKAPRKLAWKPALGCVTLDVHFDDGSVVRDVTCTPLHATILHHFGERRRWPLKELAEALGVSRDLTKRKLRLWLNRGFLHEVPPDGKDGDTTYTAASSLGNGDAPRHVTEEDDEGDGADAKAKQLEDEMKVCMDTLYPPPPTTHHPPPTTHHLPPTTYHLPPTTYHLPPTTYHSPRTTYHPPPTTHPPTTYPPTYDPPPTTHRCTNSMSWVCSPTSSRCPSTASIICSRCSCSRTTATAATTGRSRRVHAIVLCLSYLH